MEKSKRKNSIILTFLMAITFFVSVIMYANTSIDTNKKKIQYDSLVDQLNSYLQTNEELDYLINNADEAELYEHLARERGYAYPDEKVYYDVTPGK